MAYFLILPAWILTLCAMGVITLCARFVEPMRSWFPFTWRILLWSSVGFLLANAAMIALFLVPGLVGDNAPNIPNTAKYGFAALLIFGPVIASALGFFGGTAFGVWLSVRFKAKFRA